MMRRYVIIVALFLSGGSVTRAVTPQEAQELAEKIFDILDSCNCSVEAAQEVEELIEQGANINATRRQNSLSHGERDFALLTVAFACECLHHPISEILLRSGALMDLESIEKIKHSIQQLEEYLLMLGRLGWSQIRSIFLGAEYGVRINLPDAVRKKAKETREEGFFMHIASTIILENIQVQEIPILIQKENDWKELIYALRLAAGQGKVDIVKLLLTRLQQLATQESITDHDDYIHALLKVYNTLTTIITRTWNAENIKFAAAPRDLYVHLRNILSSFIEKYYAWLWHNSLRALSANGSLPEELAAHILQHHYPEIPSNIINGIVHQFYNHYPPLYAARAQAAIHLIEELFNLAQHDIEAFRVLFQVQSHHLSEQSLETLRSRLEYIRSTSAPSSPAVQRLDLVLPIIYDELRRRSIAEPTKKSLDEQLEQAVKDGDLSDVRDLLKKVKIISPTLLELAGRELALESNPRLQRISPELIEARRDILRLIQERLAPSVRGPHRAPLSGESA